MTVDILDKAEGKGRLERIFTDELADIDVTEMDAKESVRWSQMIRCGDSLKGAAERRRRK